MAKRAKRSTKSNAAVTQTKVGNTSLSTNNHDKLMSYLMGRLAPHICDRDTRITNYNTILRGLAATTKNNEFEKDKAIAYAKGETNIVNELRYPKTLGHVKDITANVMNVLFPARQMYGSVELLPSKQEDTALVVGVMNKNAKDFHHYSNFYRAVHDGIAFNICMVEADWKVINGFFGNAVIDKKDVTRTTNKRAIKEGNFIKRLDIYNTIIDSSTIPSQYASEAELYATVDVHSDYDIKRMAQRGELTLTAEYAKSLVPTIVKDGKLGPAYASKFYSKYANEMGKQYHSGLYERRDYFRNEIHQIMEQGCEESGKKRFNLTETMGNGSHKIEDKTTCNNELLTVTIRLIAKDFGLGGGLENGNGEFEIWRFKILNGDSVVYADRVGKNHGLLPMSICRPNAELSDFSSLSMAELLMPFQEASSSMLNMFLKQVRSDKNKGITFYRSDKVSLSEMADPSSGRIGVSGVGEAGEELDLRKLIVNVQGHPVSNTAVLADQHLESKMQDVFPTQAIDNLANLNRPVTHQSRQVSALQNLPVFILARLIHEELVEPVTYMQTQDILNSGGNVQKLDPATQETASVPLESLKNFDMSLAVSDGLRGIDVVALAERLQNLLQYAFQSGEIQKTHDLVKLTGFLLNLEGANIDMDAFKFANPFDALPIEQKEIAMQLLQQAAAEQEGGQQQ